jgi:hypothetical protein
VHRLLAGSEAAGEQLSSFGQAGAQQIEAVVRTAFASGMRGAMGLTALCSVAGAAVALVARQRSRTTRPLSAEL